MGHPDSYPYTLGVTVAMWFEVVGFGAGLLFGSFLNVCISRLPGHESVVTPRSRCMSVRACDALVRQCADFELGGAAGKVPGLWGGDFLAVSGGGVGDWGLVRDRGRPALVSSQSRDSITNGQVGAWMSERLHRRLPDCVSITILGFLLIGLMVMDWQTMRLPDAFTLPGIGIGFVLVCVRAMFLAPGEGDIVLDTTHQLRMSSPGSFQAQGNVFLTGTEAMVLGRVAAICGAALILLVVRWGYRALRKRDGMGLGDVKLLAMIAAFLGFWRGGSGAFCGVVCGEFVWRWLMVRGRARRGVEAAAGEFYCGGRVGGGFVWGAGGGVVCWGCCGKSGPQSSQRRRENTEELVETHISGARCGAPGKRRGVL